MNLIGEEIQVDVIVAAGKMYIHDDVLIKRRKHETETAIQVFDLTDFSLLSYAIGRGRGPGELANPAGGVIDKAKEDYWLADWAKNCYYRFPLDSLLKVPNCQPTWTFPVDPSLIPTYNVFFHASGNIGFTSVLLQKNLISFMNLNGKLVDSLAIPNKVSLTNKVLIVRTICNIGS